MNAIVGEGSKVKWGAIIAGAAIATGAVLFGGIMVSQLPEAIGTAIQEVFKKVGEWATTAHAPEMSAAALGVMKKILGAGLIGGGVAYFLGGKESPAYDPALQSSPADESFALKEDMRRMQGLMVARAAASGNPQAQAMLSQQTGRG